MSTISAIFEDGGQLLWRDGEVTGDPWLLQWLDDPPAEIGTVTPDGPSVPLADARSDPWCFVALVQEIQPGIRLRMRGEFPALPAPPADQLR